MSIKHAITIAALLLGALPAAAAAGGTATPPVPAALHQKAMQRLGAIEGDYAALYANAAAVSEALAAELAEIQKLAAWWQAYAEGDDAQLAALRATVSRPVR